MAPPARDTRDGYFIAKGGKRRKNLGRRPGYRPSDEHAERVAEMRTEGLTYRVIARKKRKQIMGAENWVPAVPAPIGRTHTGLSAKQAHGQHSPAPVQLGS